MTDSYQPIYDAVRSKISNGDVGSAVESALLNANLGFCAEQVRQSWQQAAWEYERPSVLYRPKIYMDGDKWCALYGDNLQDGVAGFGDSPAEAMGEFDKAWRETIPEGKIRGEERQEQMAADGQFGVGA